MAVEAIQPSVALPRHERRKVLLIGLDAADAEVIQDLSRRGHMPNLKGLLDRGTFARLSSPADLYAGGVWPTFYTGRAVASHGLFHSKLWRPEVMRVEVPARAWLPACPFWEHFTDASIEVCAVDVPMVLDQPAPIRGTTVSGWGTHDLIHRGSWPPELWKQLERRVGKPAMEKERFGRQTACTLDKLSRMLLEATRQQRDLAVELLTTSSWDFACVVFGAIHRAGHYLWDRSQAEGATTAPCDGIRPEVVAVHRAVDAALGDVLAAAPDDALVIAFAVHGMGPNSGWADLFPEILAAIQRHHESTPAPRGLLYRLKRRMPHHLVRPILTQLPRQVTELLVRSWSRHMHDWSRTRYFAVPMDNAGYVRINLAGRERLGVVQPSQYESLCDELERLISGLVHADSGRPIAGPVHRAYRDADPGALGRTLLPDLVVPFTGPRAAECHRLLNTELPEFDFRVGSLLPSGRSGNHTRNAWMIATGPGVTAGRCIVGHSVLDLMPTVLEYLGEPPDPGAEGIPIPLGPRP